LLAALGRALERASDAAWIILGKYALFQLKGVARLRHALRPALPLTSCGCYANASRGTD